MSEQRAAAKPMAPDLHVRLREARELFGTPASMALLLVVAVKSFSGRDNLTVTDRENLATLAAELETLAYWCASVGVR